MSATTCKACGKKAFLIQYNENRLCKECQKVVTIEKDEENNAQFYEELEKIKNITVTATDLIEPYEIIAPIIYSTSNRGIFSSAFLKLSEKYTETGYQKLLIKPDLSPKSSMGGVLLLSLFDVANGYEGDVGQNYFDIAYYMSIAEMKIRARQLGGDAIVGLRMDFDLDTTNMSAFYLQMYGTVVKKNNL